MIQVRVRPPCWGPDEEQILFNYVEAHVFSTGHIDWTDINNYLPNRTLSQCTSKLHRMRKLGKKNIRDNNTVIQVDVLLAVLQAMK